ncbi:hypothetical protein Q8F55_009207 [Vanrija albida]|uniref:FAS1 domain-containing protein n=1 Tax=Vanrija albida TaxID=181172 RepID=A0ABR3PSZ3_9TREE
MRILHLLLAAAGAAAANTSLAPLTFPVSSADPVLSFAPVGPRSPDTQGGTDPGNAPTGANSVPPADGWEMTYSDVNLPLSNITFNTLGAGRPKRTSSKSGATVTLKFVGTGVVFYGNSSDRTGYGVRVDGFPVNTAGGDAGLLVNVSGLPYAQHQAILTVNSGTIDFYSAAIVTALQTQGFAAEKANVSTVSTVTGANKALNPAWVATSTGGTPWAGRWDWAGTAWDHVGTTGQDATLQYSVPANTSYLALYGGTAGWNGDYQVSFVPALSSENTGTRASQYNLWRGQDVLLWAGPLDPAVKYDLWLKTLLSNWWIDVSQVRTWSALDGAASAPKDDKKSSTPIGAIVGGVVGGVLALLAIIALVIFLRRRNRQKESPLDILDSDMYEYHPPGAAQHHPQTPPVGEEHALLTPFTSAPPTSPSIVGSGSGSGSTPALVVSTKYGYTPRPEITRQETDAGAVVNVVPPSYDPQWAAGSGAAGGSPYAASLRASTFTPANELAAFGDLLLAHASAPAICAALDAWRANANVTLFVPPEDGGETLALLASEPALIRHLYTDGTTRSIEPGRDFIFGGSLIPGQTRTASGLAYTDGTTRSIEPGRDFIFGGSLIPGQTRTASGLAVNPWRRNTGGDPPVRDFLTFAGVDGADLVAEVLPTTVWLGMDERETGWGNASWVYRIDRGVGFGRAHAPVDVTPAGR